MGVFGALKNAVTSPFRAIGDLARLKIRKAVGDITDGAKVSLPIALAATGVGAPLALGLGAAEGAADSWGHGQNNIGKIALGAGAGAATALAANAAGGAFRGGVRVPGGVPGVAGGETTSIADVGSNLSGDALAQAGGDDYLASVGEAAGGAAGPAASVAPAVSSVVPNVPAPQSTGFLKGGAFKSIGTFAKKNPAIVAQAAGGALNTLAGANTASRQLDIEAQQVQNQKEEADRRAKLEELMAMMQGYQSFRPQYRPIGG